MRKTAEELKEEQKKYYARLNEILVKVQDGELTGSKAEDEIESLNSDFHFLDTKASICIIKAMSNEYANFDENSNC